jgi:hypothetical protein
MMAKYPAAHDLSLGTFELFASVDALVALTRLYMCFLLSNVSVVLYRSKCHALLSVKLL